ncbi:DMT family transporter [Blastococcus sp. URHD0036]|uniref:DMT family transporter n=1 Tax=Blastococcus sp. URHD0036 TaxID=1380356 RepID=UPI0012DCA01B|nr:DMT family transporter [Blastococcus sp. URHD0036]
MALAAAVAFGWSTALMHHGASGTPEDAGGLLGLLRHIVRQWRWWLGMAASLGGLALHALALHVGTIALVQPLVVTGLVFAFLFRSALDRRLPSRRTMRWVLLTAAGLTVFLLAARAESGSDSLDTSRAAVLLVLGGAAVTAGWVAALRVPRHAGLLLGAAAGVVYGLVAGTLKATSDTASSGLGTMFTSWPVYVLAVLGVAGFLLNQQAYRRAPLSRSAPAANTVNPVVALVFGVVAFGETTSGSAAAITAEVLGLIGILAGVFLLARTDEVAAAS